MIRTLKKVNYGHKGVSSFRLPGDLGLFILLILWLIGCGPDKRSDPSDQGPRIAHLEVPSTKGGESNLHVGEHGRKYLTWIEYVNDSTDRLMISTLKEGKWQSPGVVASGSDWFVNWADFPGLMSHRENDEHLAVFWLQKSAEGTYDYDIRIAQSDDGGASWDQPFTPHTDGVAAEHGFVTMTALDSHKTFAAWLDGRNTKGHAGHTTDSDQNAMMLRSAIFDKSGALSEEHTLDERVCDCCQTASARTKNGLIVAYRDRLEGEVRDISTVRSVHGKWTEPKRLYHDGWEIAGCPVNGPAIDAKEDTIALAWFTMANGEPSVKLSFSLDGGNQFTRPVRLDSDEALGRVDVLLLKDGIALVTWMEAYGEKAIIWAAMANKDGKAGQRFEVAQTTNNRRSGFPRMATDGQHVFFTWTSMDSVQRPATAFVSLPDIMKLVK